MEELQGQLAIYKATIDDLTKQISTTVPLPPLCKERFVSDDFTLTHTDLPNLKVLIAIFDHVSKTVLSDRVTKLSPFQEFACALVKLRTNIPNNFWDIVLEFLLLRFQESFKVV